MASWWAVCVAALVFAASFALTGRLREWLVARAILDRPGARSSHSVPVPRGGGLVLIPAVLAGWLALAPEAPRGTPLIVAAAALLAALSWRDDRTTLPVSLRLAAHAVAVAVGLLVLPPLFPLPFALDRALSFVLWLWFVELYNFMDGIDGLTASETSAIGLGVALLQGPSGIGALGLAAAAGAAGFLRWNWHPARLFLGDVGSVPLGYLIGFLLLALAARGGWAAALVLPLYYLADASLTLAGRAARFERVWEAHRGHFYQRALGRDGDHAAVVRLILGADAVLVVLALVSTSRPASALVLAAVTVAALIALLRRRAAGG